MTQAGSRSRSARHAAQHARRGRPGPRTTRAFRVMLVGYAIVWIVTAISPKYFSDWLLENLLVFAFVGVLAATWRRFTFSDFSWALIALFLALHAYGAHYTYSETPFGDWLRDALGLRRNHYDRIVHFAYGLLLAYPLREIAQRVLRVRAPWAWLLPFFVTLAMSAGYEIVESWVARLVSPELGTAYLGTQGDEWDAQKDMSLAMTGSLLALTATSLWIRGTGREPRDSFARRVGS